MNKRLPTIEEWQELINNCTWEWDDEKKEMTVTGKNGNSIFLPANGFRGGTDLYGVGSFGEYWSLSLNTGYPRYAWYVGFVSGVVLSYDDGSRNFCLSVRLVSDTKEDGFIDLGLPSGLLWAEKNVEGYYTYDEAMKLFEDEGIEANDSELKGESYTIPGVFEARIEDNKVILEPKESEDERTRKEIIFALKRANHRGIYNKHIAYLEKQKEQKPMEYLSKDKVYAIMNKLTTLSFSTRIPINSDEIKKIDEITSDVRELLNYPIKQEEKPDERSEEEGKQIRQIERIVKEAGCTPQLQKQLHNFLKSLSQRFNLQSKQDYKGFARSFMTYLDENRPEGKMCISNGECADIELAFKDMDWGRIVRYVEKYSKKRMNLEEEIKKYTESLYNETFGNGQGTLDEFDWEDIASVIEDTAKYFHNTVSHWKPSEGQMRCLDMVLCDEAMDDNVHRVLAQLREQLKKL